MASHQSVKQYDYVGQAGFMACGIAAGCGAGADWDTLYLAAVANGHNKEKGMQPSQAANAYRDVYGSGNVEEQPNWSLQGIYDSLKSGKVVIVDILVNSNYVPSSINAFSHFARVLAMDWENQKIFIENTLPGGNYWELSFDEFNEVWFNPEKRVSIKPKGMTENDFEEVGNWGVAINQ